MQRLIDSADQSLDLLASLGELPTPGPARSTGFGLDFGLDSSAAMSTESFHFSTFSGASSGGATDSAIFSASNGHFFVDDDEDDVADAVAGRETEAEGEQPDQNVLMEPVVGISVRKGFLHVKGVFSDHSVEFVDIDPRFTTVGDLKHALCERRETAKELGFAARDARVMFGGQLVEDDWLVVDCGMGFDGALHIVKAVGGAASGFANTGSFLSGRNGLLFDAQKTKRTDPKLSISSIASVYAASQTAPHQFPTDGQQQSTDPMMTQLSAFSQALSLNAGPQVAPTQGEVLSRHVRPEEATFAEIASDFYENLDRVQNSDLYCEKLLSGYIDVLQTRLEKLEALVTGSNKSRGASTMAQRRLQNDIKELRDERNTWRLLFELRQVCHTDSDTRDGMDGDSLMMLGTESEELRFEMLEDDAVRLLETRNETYKIQQAVKMWLENMALEHAIAISDKRGANGSRTLKLLRKQLLSGEDQVRMDPDAVLRNGDDHILADDTEDEAELMKSVWLFLRAGRINDAIDLCIRLGQAWRAASLSGGTPVGASESSEREDLALERWGNPLRALWKTTCWRFSEQPAGGNLFKGSSLLAREYEELIYAALSGNIQVITKSSLCESWEDHCWAYLQGITEQQHDEILFKLLKVKMQSSQLIVGNNAHYLRHYSNLLDKTKYLKRYQVDLDALFEELRGSQSELVRMQANQPHCHIQAKLVTAKFEYIVSSILDTLLFNAEDDNYNWDLQLNATLDETSPLFLRFAAHFIMFAGFTGENFDAQAGHMILKLYIRHLVKHRQLQFVPVYASRLPTEGAIEIYVQLLATVDDSLERDLCVKRILDYAGMDVLTTVLQSVVKRLCDKYRATALEQQKQKEQPLPSDVPTTDIDRRRMRTLEFLCFYSEHRAEALVRANILTRQFLLEGKFAAVKELVEEHLPEDSIGVLEMHRAAQLLRGDAEIERAMREFLCWRAFIQASMQYDLWRNCIASPGLEALSLYSEEKEFLADLMFHVSRSAAATLEALHFENGWLLECSDDAEQDATIRERCLPTLVFNLHFIQLESAKMIMRLTHYPDDAKVELARPLLEKSIEVADVVADEHYAVYKALGQDQCRDLLHGFRESAVALTFVESLSAVPVTPNSP
ncbi:hypothetical protein BBJ28_00013925 [Nothophytophthora sp. Chile5]|nr:hypothetical protein BBJ28_00013925 [Nothophytophthora sp. Chile5]